MPEAMRAAILIVVTNVELEEGMPVDGICLYPVADYPGWSNGRHCKVGLLGFPDKVSRRPVHTPLADELLRQQVRFDRLRSGANDDR
ncbi:hypothetical protein [Skermanella aerolata]|uniref:hypothetical protein n=1 Tax=Skermanella aerolata TaxID=393310 RepID=UPI0012FAA826|nr:hypothetical protein [Skermanella aerolata]